MLFRKDIEPRCAYCRYAGMLSASEVTCAKKGVVSAEGSCRRFKYDPLKRVPPKPARLMLRNVKDEDFQL